MKITFTTEAQQQLLPLLEQNGKQLKFVHDTEGCGCVVSGVPALQIIDSPLDDDLKGEADPIPFYYQPQYAVFYEPEMKIDFNNKDNSYSLKSNSQIYTTHLKLIK